MRDLVDLGGHEGDCGKGKEKAQIRREGHFYNVMVGNNLVAQFDGQSDDFAWSNARSFAEKWNALPPSAKAWESDMSNEKYTSTLSGPCREKLWTERDVDQKLEALRDELLWALRTIRMLEERSNMMLAHSHLGTQLVVPVGNYTEHSVGYVPTGLREKE